MASMQYDVKAIHTETTGTPISTRNRVKGMLVTPGGTAGDIIFRDGGASGTTLIQFNISTSVVAFPVVIPGEGVLFETNVHVTLPASAKVTVFYG